MEERRIALLGATGYTGQRVEGAENSCYLGGCSAERSPASGAEGAGLGLSGRAMIFGLWA
jgi:hypothetical protein